MNIKCKELSITTNGTTNETKVKADGKTLGLIQRISISADAEDSHIIIQAEVVAKGIDGKPKTKKVSLRDPQTQKLVESEKVVVEPLRIEFEK